MKSFKNKLQQQRFDRFLREWSHDNVKVLSIDEFVKVKNAFLTLEERENKVLIYPEFEELIKIILP